MGSVYLINTYKLGLQYQEILLIRTLISRYAQSANEALTIRNARNA